MSLKEIGSFSQVGCHLLDIRAFVSTLMAGFIKYCTQKKHKKLSFFKSIVVKENQLELHVHFRKSTALFCEVRCLRLVCVLCHLLGFL
jgi:hypothetical protein